MDPKEPSPSLLSTESIINTNPPSPEPLIFRGKILQVKAVSSISDDVLEKVYTKAIVLAGKICEMFVRNPPEAVVKGENKFTYQAETLAANVGGSGEDGNLVNPSSAIGTVCKEVKDFVSSVPGLEVESPDWKIRWKRVRSNSNKHKYKYEVHFEMELEEDDLDFKVQVSEGKGSHSDQTTRKTVSFQGSEGLSTLLSYDPSNVTEHIEGDWMSGTHNTRRGTSVSYNYGSGRHYNTDQSGEGSTMFNGHTMHFGSGSHGRKKSHKRKDKRDKDYLP